MPISARLAEDLGVTPPAVTAALKRMTRTGYLRVMRDGRIALSAKGKGIAQHLVLRHQARRKTSHRSDWHQLVARARRSRAPRARHFARSGGTFVETLWPRRSLSAWRSAFRRHVKTAQEIRRGAFVRRRSRPLLRSVYASSKRIRNFSSSWKACSFVPAPMSASISANMTKPWPCPSRIAPLAST